MYTEGCFTTEIRLPEGEYFRIGFTADGLPDR